MQIIFLKFTSVQKWRHFFFFFFFCFSCKMNYSAFQYNLYTLHYKKSSNMQTTYERMILKIKPKTCTNIQWEILLNKTMLYIFFIAWHFNIIPLLLRSHRGRDHMVVVITTTCAISDYHHKCCEFESHSLQGVLKTTLCDKDCQWLEAVL